VRIKVLALGKGCNLVEWPVARIVFVPREYRVLDDQRVNTPLGSLRHCCQY